MPSNEVLASAAFFLVSMLAYAWSYMRKPPPAPPATNAAVIAGIGGELGNREQTERLIEQIKRIADGMDVLADKRTDEFEAMHVALLDRLDAQERREEQEEQKPRRPPRRRP